MPPRPARSPAPDLLTGDGLIRALYRLDHDGRSLRAMAGDATASPFDAMLLADGRARVQASPAGRLTIGGPWAEPEGHWVFPVSRATLDAGTPPVRRHRVGLVSLFALQPLLDSVDTGRDGCVALFLRDGWMLATAPRNDALLGRCRLQTPMFQVHLGRAATGTVRRVVVRDGTERIDSHRERPQGALVVSTGLSMTDALEAWRARFVLDVSILLVVGAAGVWGAAVLSRNDGRRESAERIAAQAARRIEQSERFVREVTDNLPMRIARPDKDWRFRFAHQPAACSSHGHATMSWVGPASG